MIRTIKKALAYRRWMGAALASIPTDLEALRRDVLFLQGQIAARDMPHDLPNIQAAEFKVFSQFGEDGIIQFLVKRLAGHIPETFVEFGVQTYMESNTLFLLMNNGWRGLVIDGEPAYIEGISRRGLDWRYGLKTHCEFVTRDNINRIFSDAGFAGQLGLLSIDVDGMDWHLWDALAVTKPGIVVIEYNRTLPIDRPITVPYEPVFDRNEKHPSKFYFGASLSALTLLADRKGYKFLGVERHRRNAFFVRQDLADHVPAMEATNRDEAGVMETLNGMPFLDVRTGLVS